MIKLTKFCLQPWTFFQVHAGGMIQCCAVANDTDMGDFIIDHCQKAARGETPDVFNSPAFVRLREGLLTGNLRPMCRRCFFRPDELITTVDLAERVKKHLRKYLPDGTDVNSVDLARVSAPAELCISFTNRCNSRCVYCVQSVLGDTNPYFKMDFPEEYAESTLDFFASFKIDQIRSCVEGEPTLYKRWYEVTNAFKEKYPHIELYMTTNLSRRYSEKEIELLAKYKCLDVSCDTLDPELYSRMRPGSNLPLVLENLHRVKAKKDELGLNIPGGRVSMHTVVSDVTWPTLDAFADYAFANGFVPLLGYYEERPNSLAYRHGLCRPLTSMPEEEQRKAQQCILRIKGELEKRGRDVGEFIQGGLLYNLTRQLERQYNRFKPYDENPLHAAFYRRFPSGDPDLHLDIVYDHDNIAYNGVLFSRPGTSLRLEGFAAKKAVVREVIIYKSGCCSTKYGQTTLPGYRKTVSVQDDIFEYVPGFTDETEKVLLEVSEWW